MDRDDHPASQASTLISNLDLGLQESTKSVTTPKKRKSAISHRASKAPVGPNTFILDTNVLLHDPASLQKFAEHEVCIPVDVLSELDRFKNEMTERGANAREAHRALTKIFSAPDASVLDGVKTLGGGKIRLLTYDPDAANRV